MINHALKKQVARLNTSNTLFFLCDIQTVFESKIYNMKSIIHSANTLCKASTILDIPLLVTEHNPKAFGRILPAIKENISSVNSTWFEKTHFSMITDDVQNYLSQHDSRKNVVLFGIETHVCIQQTTLDLLSLGYDVHLIADGVSSQREHDRTVALHKLTSLGAQLTSAESVIFELLADAKNPKFKECLPLFKAHRPADEHFPKL